MKMKFTFSLHLVSDSQHLGRKCPVSFSCRLTQALNSSITAMLAWNLIDMSRPRAVSWSRLTSLCVAVATIMKCMSELDRV